jgi:hypothetical protein
LHQTPFVLLVDTNVFVDVLEDDPVRADWSVRQLRAQAQVHELTVNPVIYAELSLVPARRRKPQQRPRRFLHRRPCRGRRLRHPHPRRRAIRELFSPRSTRYASIGPGTMSCNEAETRFYLIDPVLRAKEFDEHWKLRLETLAPVTLVRLKALLAADPIPASGD